MSIYQENTMKKLESIDLVIQKFFRFFGQIGIVAIISMMLVIVFDVGGRFFFNSPIPGTVEIVELQNIILSFFALIWCTLNLEHIRVTLLDNLIPDKIKFYSDTVFYLLGAGFYAFISVQNVKVTQEALSKGTSTIVVGIPLFPVYIIIAFSCACVAAILLIAVIKNIYSVVKK